MKAKNHPMCTSLNPSLAQSGAEMPQTRTTIAGELATRLARSFERLEQPDYQPDSLREHMSGEQEWPGDYAGRTILALANLARVTGRTPAHLGAILGQLPPLLNSRGFLGPVPEAADGSALFDEQQLSGHGWLVSGLLAASDLAGDSSLAQIAERIVNNLFLPLCGRMAAYPIHPDSRSLGGDASGKAVGRVGDWRLSSDIGCVFIALEGVATLYERTRRPDLLALIDEMAQTLGAIDLLSASMQLHASLTAARQLLRCHGLTDRPGYLTLARRIYDLFRTRAMTENHANYNWFSRALSWTEPCAIVDSLICAIELWRKTGDARYLADAHEIYYNALGFAQKPHGGFGLENCAGPAGAWLVNQTYDVTCCCNMRGAVGLAALVDYVCIAGKDELILPFYFDSQVTVEFADGVLALTEATDYPYAGSVCLTVEQATIAAPKTLRLFVPPWADLSHLSLTVNSEPAALAVEGGFAAVTRRFAVGDSIKLTFVFNLRTEPTFGTDTAAGFQTFRHGPLLLGTDSADNSTPPLRTLRQIAPGTYQSGALRLAPLNDSLDLSPDKSRGDRRRILFAREDLMQEVTP